MIRKKIAILFAAGLMASIAQHTYAAGTDASGNLVEKIFVRPPAIFASGLNLYCSALVLDAAFLTSAIISGFSLKEAIKAKREGKPNKEIAKKGALGILGCSAGLYGLYVMHGNKKLFNYLKKYFDSKLPEYCKVNK